MQFVRPCNGTGSLCLSGRRLLCLAAMLLPMFCGCGGDGGPERATVSGVVRHNGKPIPVGTIRFLPVATSPVPVAGADIMQGVYRVDNKGGVAVGTYKVVIEAYREIHPKAAKSGRPAPGWGTPRQQYLPRQFNANSQLQMTVEPGSRTITKDFDLTD